MRVDVVASMIIMMIELLMYIYIYIYLDNSSCTTGKYERLVRASLIVCQPDKCIPLVSLMIKLQTTNITMRFTPKQKSFHSRAQILLVKFIHEDDNDQCSSLAILSFCPRFQFDVTRITRQLKELSVIRVSKLDLLATLRTCTFRG